MIKYEPPQSKMNNGSFDWNALWVFLSVARNRTLSSAARELQLSQPTVGRAIAKLEAELGVSLFVHRRSGFVLTPDGEALVPLAERMQINAADVVRAVASRRTAEQMTVIRIAVGELSMHFLAAHLPDAISNLSPIRIEMLCSDAFQDLSLNEADLAIRNKRPRQSHLIAQKIGDVEMHVYASPQYCQLRPDVLEKANWSDQTWARYGANRSRLEINRILDDKLDGTPPTFAVDRSQTVLELVRSGAAIGCLPDWIAECEGLIRISDELLVKRTAWLCFHENLLSHPQRRAVKNRVREIYAERFRQVSKNKRSHGPHAH